MKQRLARLALMALALGVTLGPRAIVPDLPTTDWPYAGRFGVDSLGTSAVAISDRWVLTAGHAAYMSDPDGRFQMDGGPVYSSIKVYRHPTDDIAVVEFADPFPGWYPIYSGGSEVGFIGEAVGYGGTGEIVNGEYEYTGGFGIKRAGRNRVTFFQFLNFGDIRGTFLVYDFDGSGRDTFGDGGPVTNECTYGGGDSGGPTFILDGGVWKVAGIHSWVGSVTGGPPPPRHGSVLGDIRVASYATWINSIVPRRVIPTSFTVNNGTLLSGGLSDLFYSDNQYLRIRELPQFAAGLPSARVTIDGVSPLQTPSRITLRGEVATTAFPPQNLVLRTEMFNMQTNSFELVDTRSCTSSDSMLVITPAGDPARFVQTGTGLVRMRLSWFNQGNLVAFGWNSRIDFSIWEIYQ